MDITTKTLTELQALAYQLIIEIQKLNQKLSIIENEIAKKIEVEKAQNNQKTE